MCMNTSPLLLEKLIIYKERNVPAQMLLREMGAAAARELST